MKSALVVDDSSYMRTILKMILVDYDCTEIYEADNGETAVAAYKAHSPDIVFMDILMEKMYGIEALRQIIEYDKDAKVIMVSSIIGQDPIAEEAKALGALGFLSKPVDEKHVAEIIGRIMF